MVAHEGRPWEAPFASLSSDITRVVLENGVRVLVREVYPSKVASLSIWAGVGSADELPGQAGFSHFLEHLMFKGHRLGEEIQTLGGHLNGFTSYECTCFWTAFPSRHLPLVLELQAAALKDFRPDDEVCRRESQVLVNELNLRRDDPSTFCLEQLLELSFPGHPYGRSVAGNPRDLFQIERNALLRFHEAYYVPDNLAVVVVGGVDTDEVLGLVESAFGPLRGPPRPPRPSFPPPPAAPRLRELSGELSSAYLYMGFPIPNLFSADAFSCDLLASVLGRGRSSRLHQRVREQRELVTAIGASTFLGRDPGLLLVRCVLPPDRVEEAELAVFEVINEFVGSGLERRELDKARNLVEAAFIFSQETVEGQGHKIGYYEMIGDFRLADQYVHRLWQIDKDQLLDCGRRFLSPQKCARVRYRPGA